MIRFACLLLLFPLLASTAGAESVVVAKSWAKVRREPAVQAAPIGLVYGNDVLQVLGRQTGWVQVQLRERLAGWVAEADVGPNGDLQVSPVPRDQAMAHAVTLQRIGRIEQARDKLVEILLRYPDSAEFYEAMRRLMSYYRMADLPQPKAPISAEDLLRAERLLVPVLVRAGRERVAEGQYLEAVPLFEEAFKRAKDDPMVRDGLERALLGRLQETLVAGDAAALSLAAIAYRQYFPGRPLPPAVQERLVGGATRGR